MQTGATINVNEDPQGGPSSNWASGAAISGDGRVTRTSAMLPGVRTWHIDCEHGNLPKAKFAFDGFLDLLERGDTDRLARVDDTVVSRGAEGPTDNPEVNALRSQQRRNFMTTLLLSAGVPMMLAGDEFGHSQDGNNNAYCQDNEITWLNWNFSDEQRQLFDFVGRMIRLHREQPVLRRRTFFQGRWHISGLTRARGGA